MTGTTWQSASIPLGPIVSAYGCLHAVEGRLCDRWTYGRWEQFGPLISLQDTTRLWGAKGVSPNFIIRKRWLQWVKAKINHLKKI